MAARGVLQCTFVEVDQTPHTHGVVLSKAAWSWGAEMGANDQGLAGGNAAVWTVFCHPGDHEERLLGTDFVRSVLALPRLVSSYLALPRLVLSRLVLSRLT